VLMENDTTIEKKDLKKKKPRRIKKVELKRVK